MAKVYEGCRTAGIGCIECKGWAADSLWQVLAPIQERRAKYEADPKLAWDILEDGSTKARAVAEATMVEARDAANLSHEYEPPAQSAGEGKRVTIVPQISESCRLIQQMHARNSR